jgi:hypothetical protein
MVFLESLVQTPGVFLVAGVFLVVDPLDLGQAHIFRDEIFLLDGWQLAY